MLVRVRARASVLLPALAILAGATPATAAAGGDAPRRLPEGALVAGVPVGGLGPIDAERELRRVLAPRYGPGITVKAGRRRYGLAPRRAGLDLGYDAMVRRAFELARRGRVVDVPLDLSVDGRRLSAAVRAAGRRLGRAPRNARVRFGVRRVVRIRHRSGRAVDARRLRRELLAELRAPSEARTVAARLRSVRPRITTSRLGRVHHTFVSVDRRTFTLRLFKRLRVVRRYRVAVGAAGYDTPAGLHRVISRRVNPAWHAPNRPWAGALAGRTIPPGDPRNPLKARWIGLGGAIGIHGTAQEGSIGSRASHGCIRMRVGDVKRLYPKLPLRTPVLIR